MKLENRLCSNAHPSQKKFNPLACQTCISPCGPGRRWLEQMGMQAPKRVGSPQTEELYLRNASKLKMIINRRCTL